MLSEAGRIFTTQGPLVSNVTPFRYGDSSLHLGDIVIFPRAFNIMALPGSLGVTAFLVRRTHGHPAVTFLTEGSRH